MSSISCVFSECRLRPGDGPRLAEDEADANRRRTRSAHVLWAGQHSRNSFYLDSSGVADAEYGRIQNWGNNQTGCTARQIRRHFADIGGFAGRRSTCPTLLCRNKQGIHTYQLSRSPFLFSGLRDQQRVIQDYILDTGEKHFCPIRKIFNLGSKVQFTMVT